MRHPSDGRLAIGHHHQKLLGRVSGTLKGHSRGHGKSLGHVGETLFERQTLDLHDDIRDLVIETMFIVRW